MKKCEYGCNQIAKFQFKNGKYCCSDNISKCNGTRKQIGLKNKNKMPWNYNTKGIMKAWNKGKTNIELFGEKRAKQISENKKNKLKGKITGLASTVEKEIERRNKLRDIINKRYETGWLPKAGRCKKIKYVSPIAGEVLLDGNWELKVALYFDKNKINWRKNKKRFNYFFNKKNRNYTPDFYLIIENKYIEVKGYETEKDRAKWSQFPEKIEIWKKKELKELKII